MADRLSLLQRLRGYAKILTNEGEWLSERYFIRLGPGLTATDDKVNGHTVLDVVGSISLTFAAVKAALAAASSAVGLNAQGLTGVGYIQLANGAQIYGTSATTTDNTTPATLLSVPVADGHALAVRYLLFGRTTGGDLIKEARDLVLSNNAGTISIPGTGSSQLGSLVNTTGGPVVGTSDAISGGNYVLSVTGAAATAISWRLIAEVLAL